MNKPEVHKKDEKDQSKKRVKEYKGFFAHIGAYVVVNIGMFFVDIVMGDGINFSHYLLILMGIALAMHGAIVFFGPQTHRLATKLQSQEAFQTKWPVDEEDPDRLRARLKESLGIDSDQLADDILKAISKLGGEFNNTGLIPASQNTNQIPQNSASTPVIPQGVAILMFTDMSGFTSYVERNGDEASHSLLKLHNHIIRSNVNHNDGIEIKNLGDGFMLCFVSAKKALQCATGILEQLKEADYPLQVRIGLHAGEPIHQDKDLTGQTVNLAARVMDQANGGQILLTEVIRNLAGNLDGFQYVDLGERRLPGLSERHKIFEFVAIEPLTTQL